MRTNVIMLMSAAALAVAATACHVDPITKPPSVPGSYTSTLIVVPGPTDGPDTVSARGGSITLKLDPDGVISGHIMFPSIDRRDTFSVDVNGIYNVKGDTVRFSSTPATLLDDETWLFTGDRLQNLDPGHRWPSWFVLKKN